MAALPSGQTLQDRVLAMRPKVAMRITLIAANPAARPGSPRLDVAGSRWVGRLSAATLGGTNP